MSNPLLELQKSLGARARTPSPARRGSKKKRTSPVAPVSSPPQLAPVPQAGLAKAAQAVDYKVPGIVQAIAQPSGMTCWATVASIMYMWRKQRSMTIPTVLEKAGAPYVTKFNGNLGLLGSEKAAFLTAMGLTYQLPQSRSPSGWESLLRQYGPIWITTDEDPSANFAIHARVMTGIHGDGTATGTTIDVVDPAGGKTYSERFDKFLAKYESEAMDPKRPVRIQIVHWPSDAGQDVLRLVRGQSAAYAQALAVNRFSTVIESEFEPDYHEAQAGAASPRAQSAFAAGLSKPAPMKAADVRWPADADSPDYRHLGVPLDTTPFALTARVLKRLAAFNRLAFDGVDNRVVFALRGCTTSAAVNDLTDSVAVQEVVPNHIDNRCVIGVWDRVAGKIAVFPASTVPNWEYMETYRQNHGKRANMQPSGRYDLVVGTHRSQSPDRVHGALRNDHKLVVLRSEDDLSFTTRDTWDMTTPFNNIHPGLVPVNDGGSTVPDYSSAGCQTIPGTSKGDVPAGPWADFRKALGLDNSNPTKDNGRKFGYLLFTGREARLCAGTPPGLDRLRFGSQGEDVRKLQDALAKLPATAFKGKTDSRFGAGTAMAYIRYQKTRDKGAADGIVTPADASALGFTLGPSGAQQLGVTDIIGDIARGIFNKWRARPEAGKFAVTSDIAEFLHDDTAASQAWTRTTVEFKLKATAPGFDEKDLARGDVARASTKEFKFLLAFEHNGYDIKNAQITRVLQGSSEMKSGQFTADFKAKNATSLLAEVGRIDFNLTGTWDPGLGTKFFSFTGKAFVEADGDFGFALDKNERVSVSMVVGATFSNLKRVPGAKPTTAIRRTVVFFSPAGSSKMSDAEMTKIKAWARRLKDESVRYQRLISGKIVVNVAGHASPTGSGAMNQELSGQRAEKVLKLLKEELGSEAKFRVFKHGEDDPAHKDTKKDENEWDRRVDVWFDVTGVS